MINNLNNTPKQDNALQVARTASIPSNEKYTAAEWNAIVNKINEIITDLDLGQITDSVTKTTASNLVRLVEGALIENQLTIRNLPNATTEEKMLLLNSLGEAALADITDYIKKLEVSDPEGQYVLLADGTRIDPQTLIEEKEIVAYNTSNPRPATGESDKLYIDTDTNDAYLWDQTTQSYVGIGVIDLSNYYNKTETNNLLDGKLDTDMSNLDDDISNADRKVIREKLGAAFEGVDNDNSGNNSGSLAGETNTNSGNFSASVGGEENTNSGYNSGSVAGEFNINSGHTSGSIGGRGLQNQTYAETSRGQYNLSESNHADSATIWHDDDLIESVGVGTSSVRKNALTRWKNGAFKWLLQPLTNITNAVLGFHAADLDGRLNYHDGTDWKKYLIEGEGGSGGGYIEILNQFNDVNGDVDLDLITEEGTYVLMEMRDQDLNGLPQYAGDGPLNVQIDVFKSGGNTHQRAIYLSYTQNKPSIAYRIKDGSGIYTPWVDLHDEIDDKNFLKETNNHEDIQFWTGTQAEYDAITTKSFQTLYIIN